MKKNVDLGLSVLCSEEFRREHGPVYSYEAMAEACGEKYDTMRKRGDRALAKVKLGLQKRGLGEVEALIAIEMMAKQGCYRAPNEDSCPTFCPTC